MGWVTDFLDAGGAGDLLQGGASLYGYNQLTGDLDKTQDRIGEYGGTEGMLPNIQQDVEKYGSFQPWSVKSGLGSSQFDPATGQMTNTLSGPQQGYANQQGQGAADMYSRVMQDPSQRESDIYGRIREMQRPGEERQYNSMNADLFGGGRGGMTSGGYGGSPEQHAFGMAQGEARNQASFGAMNQAQTEMQNYAGIGQSMFQNQYMPYQQMQGFANQGLQNQQMRSQSGQGMAGLLAQLGIGGMTTDVNLQNVRGDAFTGLIEALGQAASGGGIDSILSSIIG